ncbi:MAG: DUF115 domain-containing protein [Candidatus Omnitrophica bacterium]|nr:DUF115 domain-containing protein [Candidatus Omnitrophota bacterium]
MTVKKNKQVSILDCTIRDGGYLNEWDFSETMVRDVYRQVSKSGVDYIELGFFNSKTSRPSNPWQCVSEKTLKKIVEGIPGVPIALMLDYGKFRVTDIGRAKDTLVRMFRIAVHKNEVKNAAMQVAKIKAKGYMVTLQLMGINGYSDEDFRSLVPVLKAVDLDYLYFADSYGSLLPVDLPRIFQWLRKTGQKIGYHPHNNLELGFANTLTAITEGAAIVDATVYGMGRGAGNLPLEVLIMYLAKVSGEPRYNCIPLLDLIDRYFLTLHKKLGWGYSLPYMLSGMFELHPNYATAVIDRREFDMAAVSRILEWVKNQDPEGFDKTKLDRVLKKGTVSDHSRSVDEKDITSETNGKLVPYLDRHKGRDFLILSNGPSLKKYRKQIQAFIRKYKPVVIGVNFLDQLFIPDYHGFSNKKRFTQYVDKVSPRSTLLVSSQFEPEFIAEYTNRKYERVYHLDRMDAAMDIKSGVITTNGRTVGLLMAGVATAMGAKRIFIAGMDGYHPSRKNDLPELHFYKEAEEAADLSVLAEKHHNNQEMMDGINDYLTAKGKEGLHIITPTSYGRFYTDVELWLKSDHT